MNTKLLVNGKLIKGKGEELERARSRHRQGHRAGDRGLGGTDRGRREGAAEGVSRLGRHGAEGSRARCC